MDGGAAAGWAEENEMGREAKWITRTHTHTAPHGRMSRPPKYFDNFKRNENPLFHTGGLKCVCVSTFISYIQSAFISTISFRFILLPLRYDRERIGIGTSVFALLSFRPDSFFKLPVRYTGNKIIALDAKLEKKFDPALAMPRLKEVWGGTKSDGKKR